MEVTLYRIPKAGFGADGAAAPLAPSTLPADAASFRACLRRAAMAAPVAEPPPPGSAPAVALVAPPPLPTEATLAAPAANPFASLRMGQQDAGPNGPIRAMQQVLRRWNPRLELTVDGRYDPRTAQAVLLYKAVYGTGQDGRSMDAATAANLAAMQDGSFWNHPPPKSVAGQVLYAASQQLGMPYRLGGDGSHATDCAMFTRQALTRAGAADATLSRLADEQYASARQGAHGLQAVAGTPRPGDLVFFDNPTFQSSSAYHGVTHVGFYLGNGSILAASSAHGKVVIEKMGALTHYVVGYARPAQGG